MALLDPISKALGTHTGSWGLPEFSVTEKIGSILGSPTTPQGGSNLDRSVSVPGVSGDIPYPSDLLQPANQPTGQPTTQLTGTGSPVTQLPSSGAPPVDRSFYAGWSDESAILSDWQNTWQQKIGSGTPGATQEGILSEIESLYNQNRPLFDQAEQNLAGQVQTAEGKIQTQAGQMERGLQSAYEEALTLANRQRDESAKTQQSSESALTRTYNSLVQNISAKFGLGSGTGLAASEIIAQEMLRSKGDIRQTTQGTLQKIFDLETNALKQFNAGKQKVQEDVTIMMKELQDDYRGKMLEIATSRAMNEMAKSQARIDVLRDQENFMKQIQAYRIEAQIQLDSQLKLQQEYNAGVLDASRQVLSSANTNFFNDMNAVTNTSTGFSNQFSNVTGQQQQATLPMAYRPLNSESSDELTSLNPWIA